MDLTNIFDRDIAAILVSCGGGLTRIMLGIDKDLPLWKQWVLIFISALPAGLGVYFSLSSRGYPFLAFPIAYFSGVMALSLARLVAADGAKALIDIILKRGSSK